MQQSCVFFSIAFFGNSLICLAILPNPRLRTATNHLIITLSARDLIDAAGAALSLSPSLSLSLSISQCFEFSEFPVKKEQFLPPGQIISERYMQLGCQISVFLKKI